MLKFPQKHPEITQQKDLQPSLEVKIEENQPQVYLQFQDSSRFQLLNVERKENCLEKISSIEKPQNSSIVREDDPPKTLLKQPNQAMENTSQILEEKPTNKNQPFHSQNSQLLSNNWLLPRHPNSLFKMIKPISQIKPKSLQYVLSPHLTESFKKFNEEIQTTYEKLEEIRNLDTVKIPKVQYKTKQIQKNPNFKHRKGKNQQPMAQKLIKKLSGFHYNKNYKQNRNKTLKKLAKRGLPINLENFSTYIGRLKLQINKKFTKPDMKVKKNAKGEEINPKKFYDLYHEYFSFPKEREFIEKIYNEVFKRVYVIMWKSDERLKRVDSIKIQGVHYNVETDPSYQVKIQQKDMSQEKQPVTESRPEDKRASFVQCLDEQGKKQLQEVFGEQYEKLFNSFDWATRDPNFKIPQKEYFMKRIQKFSWLED